MKKITSTILLASALVVSANTASAATLDEVKGKGFVQCGVSQGLPGFSAFDDKGVWSGVDVDVCRAVAAAIFDDDGAVKYTPLSAKERFTALQSGEIDVLSRNTTWTATRDTALGLNFAGVNYYDGQGFMVPDSLGIKNASELSGASVCTNTGTTTELNVSDYFRANGMDYTVVAFEKADEVVAAYDAGRCDVYTTDQSGLYAQRIKLKDPSAHKVLPEVISKEPLGPVVRQGDDEWFNLVKWSLFCMVNAEEMGVTSANVGAKANGGDPAVKRLLGQEGSFGENLGVSPTWCKNIVASVGNYGESFARNLSIAPLNIQRGVNELWSKGGLQYAPPIR
ncbi:MAG: amino acid ABC transporter substrate-binding protein [Gammaproteobacteria bacterium]